MKFNILVITAVSFFIIIIALLFAFLYLKYTVFITTISIQPLIGLSISLIIFPIITIPLIGDIVSNAKDLKIPINENLIRDYVNGCFIIFSISVVELLVIFTRFLLFKNNIIIDAVIISIALTMIVVLLLIMFNLWKISELLFKIITSQ